MKLKHLLLPLSPVYRGLVAARDLGFRSGAIATTTLPVPVISIGNLTFGGTGKTPTVISLVRELARRGRRPAVLTRGYRRQEHRPYLLVGPDSEADAARVGDEALELASRLPGVPISVDADRIRGGKEALRRGADVLVMDDGFQHRRLARDLDVVLVDAGDPWGGGHLPPTGRLREPVKNIRRADAVVITKLAASQSDHFDDLRESIGRVAPMLPVFGARLAPTRLLTPDGRQPTDRLAGQRVVALAGLGRPSGFETALKEIGATVVERFFFRDHHRFRPADVERASECAARSDALLVTTAKDAVKLPRDSNFWILEVEMVLLGGTWGKLLQLCPGA